MYEELLTGENPQKTYHEKIQKAHDPLIPFNKLKIDLDHLSNLVDENKAKKVKHMLLNIIPSYQSNSKIFVLISNAFQTQTSFKKKKI